jgi:hypothetical protein
VPLQVTSASNSYFTGGGNVGIATTGPTEKLELGSGANLKLFAGNLTVGNLSAPTPSAVAASGGTLASGTYYYKVTALNDLGETTASTEVSATVDGTTTNAVTVSWTAIPGATKYRVYGRASGAQDQYWETTDTSVTDTGSAGFAATVPTENTTGGDIIIASDLTVNGAITGITTLTTSSDATIGGNIDMADGKWIGLDATSGRIVFDEVPAGTDELEIMAAKVGIGIATPAELLHVDGGGQAPGLRLTPMSPVVIPRALNS